MAEGLKHHHMEGYERASGEEANAEAHKIVTSDLTRSFVAAEVTWWMTLELKAVRERR